MNSVKRIIFQNTALNLAAGPIRFTLNIYLASILLPEDYGVMVIPMIIVSFSEIFIDSGFRASLIQRATLKKSHSSSVFFLNFIISVCIFLVFWVLAKPLSIQFDISELAIIIPIVSFNLVIKSTTMVNEARLQIRGAYGKQIAAEFAGYFLGYILAIYMAKEGFGPWSLVGLFTVQSSIYAILLFYGERFVPSRGLIFKKLVLVHWRFGRNLLGTGILESFSSKVDELILAKLAGVTSIGLYSKGREYSSTLGIIGSKFFARPWFSIMSKYSNNKKYFESKYVLVFSALSFFGVNLAIGNYYFGSAVVSFLLGEAWLELIPLMAFLVIITALYYLIVLNKYSFLALGLAKINLKIELQLLIIRVIGVLFVVWRFFDNSNLVFALLSLDIIVRFIHVFIQGWYLKYVLSNKAIIFVYVNGIFLSIITIATIIFDSSIYLPIIFLGVVIGLVSLFIHAFLKSRKVY